MVEIIQLFPALLALTTQFTQKFQKPHSTVKINNSQATMPTLKHNAKYSIFVR